MVRSAIKARSWRIPTARASYSAGQVVGELTINAALAGHFGVPVALVSGDSTTLVEAKRNVPWAIVVETKRSLGYSAADCLSPYAVRQALKSAGAQALRRRNEMQCYVLKRPIVLEIDTVATAHADALDGVAGFARTGPRTVRFCGGDMLTTYQALRLVIHLGAAA